MNRVESRVWQHELLCTDLAQFDNQMNPHIPLCRGTVVGPEPSHRQRMTVMPLAH